MKKRVLPWSKLSDSVHLFLMFYAIPLLRRESRVRFVLWTVRSWLWKSQQRTRLGEIQGISEFRICWIQILDSSVGKCLKWSTPSKNWVAIELRESLEHLRSCALPAHLHAILIWPPAKAKRPESSAVRFLGRYYQAGKLWQPSHWHHETSNSYFSNW